MKFDFNNWNVDLIQEPNMLLEKLKDFNLKCKKIKSVRIVGHVFDLFGGIGAPVNNCQKCEANLKYSDEEEFERYIYIDDPIFITFEDGSQFEIDYHDGSSIKIGLNSLPNDIEPTIANNVNGNVVFSNCIGESIFGFEVSMQDEPELTYDFTGSHGMILSENQNSYISQLKIILSNSKSIIFNNDMDYGFVEIHEKNKTSRIKWQELKNGIIV